MFVETADSNTGFLHDIGNADAFQTEFAKPLGSNAHDPSVRLRLVTLRVTHLPSPFLPESAWIAPGGRNHRVSSYSTFDWMQTVGARKVHCINKYRCCFCSE